MSAPDEKSPGPGRPESPATNLAEVFAGIRQVIARAAEAYAPVFQSGLGVLAKFAQEWGPRILAAREELDRMLHQSVELGKLGWTMPFNADLREWHTLVNASSDSASADAAFEAYYSKDDGRPWRDLVQDLISRADLAEWKPLMEEVSFALGAGKYRICVSALIPVFEGVARRWDNRFENRSGREGFFRRKMLDIDNESFDFYAWSAMAAFVEMLYAPPGKSKPRHLSRHWVVHGRGLPDAILADCLRLLQAIETALELSQDAAP